MPSNSCGVCAFRSILRVVTRCCIDLSSPKNISRCYFCDLAGAFTWLSERDLHLKYSINSGKCLFPTVLVGQIGLHNSTLIGQPVISLLLKKQCMSLIRRVPNESNLWID